MDITRIEIPPFTLRWSEWRPWKDFLLDGRSDRDAILMPNEPGVYEARLLGCDDCLTIGRASDLRMRVKQGLVKGKVPHSSGKRIRALEDTSNIEIRWAATERPAAAEEELHRCHRGLFGCLPKYTERT